MGIVKYHNQINDVNFNGYSEKELNLFFTLIFLAKEQSTKQIIIPFNQLKELSNGDTHSLRFIETLKNVNKKLIRLNHEVEVDRKIHIFSLFSVFTIDRDNKELIVQINEIFSYMLNDLIGNFTRFDLLEFVNLKSSYSKNTFKLLKQWESIKLKEFDLIDFKNILGVPNSYNTSKFNEKVLKPIMTELPQYFSNLKLEKIKTGKKVTGLKFTWNGKQKEAIDIKEAEVVEIEISEQLNKAIEKAKKNRFIEKLLTLDNIEILTQMFQENDLVKGLLWAYKEVKQDISTLNYLIKTIRTGAEQKEIKIKVKENKNKEVIQEVLFDEKTDIFKVDPGKKEKISQEKYEELYKGYLKENNIAHNRGTRLGFDKLYENKYEIIETPKEKIYTINELPKEKLLSKAGKELKGVALLMRLRKISEEMKVSIEYNSEIIKEV
jgi:plasmid replication initiation protein